MWQKLKKFGDLPSSKAVLEIIRDDDSISSDIQEILTKWYSDIGNLFSGIRENPELGDLFYEEIKAKKRELENISPENLVHYSQ